MLVRRAHNQGITCFILEKEMGVKVAKKEIKLGIKASSTCSLSFDDVEASICRVLTDRFLPKTFWVKLEKDTNMPLRFLTKEELELQLK